MASCNEIHGFFYEFEATVLCLLMFVIESQPEPVFVDLLKSPEIYSQPGEIDVSESIPGLHKRFFTNTGSDQTLSLVVLFLWTLFL
jgi:hypothetical protein